MAKDETHSPINVRTWVLWESGEDRLERNDVFIESWASESGVKDIFSIKIKSNNWLNKLKRRKDEHALSSIWFTADGIRGKRKNSSQKWYEVVRIDVRNFMCRFKFRKKINGTRIGIFQMLSNQIENKFCHWKRSVYMEGEKYEDITVWGENPLEFCALCSCFPN